MRVSCGCFMLETAFSVFEFLFYTRLKTPKISSELSAFFAQLRVAALRCGCAPRAAASCLASRPLRLARMQRFQNLFWRRAVLWVNVGLCQ